MAIPEICLPQNFPIYGMQKQSRPHKIHPLITYCTHIKFPGINFRVFNFVANPSLDFRVLSSAHSTVTIYAGNFRGM